MAKVVLLELLKVEVKHTCVVEEDGCHTCSLKASSVLSDLIAYVVRSKGLVCKVEDLVRDNLVINNGVEDEKDIETLVSERLSEH
jgi:riboflavin synthase